MTTGDQFPSPQDEPLPKGMFDVSENLPPQEDLKELYTDIDGAIKNPAQTRHVDVVTRQGGATIYHEVHIGADDARVIHEDTTATGMFIKVIDPADEQPYREHWMLIENYFGAEPDAAPSALRGIFSYSFFREIKRGSAELYDIHKTPRDIEDTSLEVVVIGPDEAPPPRPEPPEEESEVRNALYEAETTITPFDIAVLRRLAAILKS